MGNLCPDLRPPSGRGLSTDPGPPWNVVFGKAGSRVSIACLCGHIMSPFPSQLQPPPWACPTGTRDLPPLLFSLVLSKMILSADVFQTHLNQPLHWARTFRNKIQDRKYFCWQFLSGGRLLWGQGNRELTLCFKGGEDEGRKNRRGNLGEKKYKLISQNSTQLCTLCSRNANY